MNQTFTSKTYDGRRISLNIKQIPSAESNKSVIQWSLTSEGGNAEYYSVFNTAFKINSEVIYKKTFTSLDARVFPAAKGSVSGEYTVNHNDDGTAEFNLYFTTAIYDESNRTTYDQAIELDSIQRAVAITSAPNFYDTDNPTIEYNNPFGNSISDLQACISLTGDNDDIKYRSISINGNSYTFKLTSEEKNLLINATTGKSRNVYFMLKTVRISTDTVFYDSIMKSFFVTETSDIKPSVIINASANNGELSSIFDGLFIWSKSKINVSVNATAKNGASISKYSTVCEGKTYTNSAFETGGILASGTRTITSTVTDSRGFSTTAEKQIYVYSYSKPSITSLGSEKSVMCFRCDSAGNKSSSGEYVYIKARRIYSKIIVNGVQKNHCLLRWRRKQKGSTTWEAWNTLITKDNTDNDNYDGIINTSDLFIKTNSYDVQVGVIDDIGEEYLMLFSIPSARINFKLGADGRTASIGADCDYSDPDSLFIGWKTYFYEGLYGTIKNTIANDVFDFAVSSDVGIKSFYTTELTLNLPSSGNYDMSVGIVCKYSETQINIFIFDFLTSSIAVNVYRNGTWGNWKYITPQ